MNSNIRQSTVRKFYKEKLEKLYETSDSFADFFPECRVGRVQLLIINSDVLDCVEIERPQQELPQVVADAYSRHFWYLQHSMTDFYLVRIPIESEISFAILVQGYVDDGWDNSGWFIEIFDEKGHFLGAGRCDYEAGDVKWMETTLKGSDFNSGSPEWVSNESSPESVSPPMWSEELFIQNGATVTHEGTLTRYLMQNGED